MNHKTRLESCRGRGKNRTPKVLTELRTNVDESEVGFTQNTLTLTTDLCKLDPLSTIAPSSNGKTADSGQSSGLRVLRAFLPLLPSVDKIVC
jgi:hypothetical protein